MSEPDKHHYLPVFYLNHWAGADGKVVRYDRPYDVVVATPTHPRSTGYERGLYRLEGYPEEQRNAIEKDFMAKLDSHAAVAMRVLLERGDPAKLTVDLRRAWTHFLMSLIVRHPARVAQITEQGKASLIHTKLRSIN